MIRALQKGMRLEMTFRNRLEHARKVIGTMGRGSNRGAIRHADSYERIPVSTDEIASLKARLRNERAPSSSILAAHVEPGLIR